MTSVCFGQQRLLYVRAHKGPARSIRLLWGWADVNRAVCQSKYCLVDCRWKQCSGSAAMRTLCHAAFKRRVCCGALLSAAMISSQMNASPKDGDQPPKTFPPRRSAGGALLRHRPWRVPVLTEGEDKYRAFSGERHNSGIRIRVAWLYRYSSKWLRGTLQATVSRNPHRRRTANMPLVFHSTGADGYDMDYTDSKSIRPRSWVRTGLVNCLRAPILWFCFLMAHASLLFGSIWSSVAFSSAAWKQNFWE